MAPAAAARPTRAPPVCFSDKESQRADRTVISICKKTQVPEEKTPNSRLAKHEKADFTGVNEHFSGEHNAEVGVFLLALIKST